jgi:hypothetical protein
MVRVPELLTGISSVFVEVVILKLLIWIPTDPRRLIDPELAVRDWV